jgi:regulator of protease activity HflC (stomatin/prohibitin superfamily)
MILFSAPLMADAVVYMRVFDLEAARYQVQDVMTAIRNLCLTQVREQVGKLTLDESFSSRDRINQALLYDLNNVCKTWGVEITRVEIQSLEPSREIVKAMELQMAAERKKRAAILQSEGERVTLVNEAQGRAAAVLSDAEARGKSMVLMAEAECERLRLEAEGICHSLQAMVKGISGGAKESVDAALQMLLYVRYMETQSKFAESNGTKVLMFPSKDTVPITYEGLRGLMN